MATRRRKLGRIARSWSVALSLALLMGLAGPAGSWEYGFRDDFHFSVREEFDQQREFQIDNYVFMDASNLFGSVDFHSGFLITNDLNLLDAEAVQLNLAYLSLVKFKDRLHVDLGRQFFSPGFDAFLGDGLMARYTLGRALTVSTHFAVPFNAESEAIDDERLYVYGCGLDYSLRRDVSPVPVKISGQLERRDPMDSSGLEQLLLGFEGQVETEWPVAADVYADLEYEFEDSRLQRARAGSVLYLTPAIACRLEGERYEPEDRLLKQQFDQDFQDAILNAFSRSEVVTGRASLTYNLPNGREIRIGYGLQRYIQRSGSRMLGHEADCYLNVLSVPSVGFLLGGGYLGRIAGEDYAHLGIVRAGISPLPLVRAQLLTEAGILNTESWDNRFVLHVRGSVAYEFRPNLELSVHLEENQNPYFASDLRAMTFVRYFWGGRVEP
jgi:hypothetical protein